MGEVEFEVELIIVLSVMICSYIAGHCIRKYEILILPESVASVILGIIFAIILYLVPTLPENFEFSGETFFYVLLPFLIFESGFSVHQKMLFRNIGSILIYAILGTIFSAFIIGGGIFLLTRTTEPLGIYRFLDSMILGGILSATDPVATLAIVCRMIWPFGKLHAEINTYCLVFGESMFNDAVSIVLFKTLIGFYKYELTPQTFFWAAGQFCVVFIGSTAIGLLMGALISLILRRTSVGRHIPLEFIFVLGGAYMSYFLPDALGLSGIVSIFFYGLNTRHYTYYVVSEESKIGMKWSFETIKEICESLVFCLLGITILEDRQRYNFLVIFYTCICLIVARTLHVVIFSFILNLVRKDKIGWRNQLVIWNAGLRGAVSYALAISPLLSYSKISDQIAAAVHAAVIFTIFFHGILTAPILKFTGLYGDSQVVLSEPRIMRQKFHKYWSNIDKKYIIPFISYPRESGQNQAEELEEGNIELQDGDVESEEDNIKLETQYRHSDIQLETEETTKLND